MTVNFFRHKTAHLSDKDIIFQVSREQGWLLLFTDFDQYCNEETQPYDTPRMI